MRAAGIGLVLSLGLLLALYGTGGRLHWPEREEAAPRSSLTASVADWMSAEDPLVRAAGLASALQDFGPEAVAEIEEAWAVVDREVDGFATVELALLVEWWARHEPEGALDWLHRTQLQRNPILMTALVRSWAAHSPIAASRAVTSLPQRRKSQDLSRLIHAVALGWNASGESGVEDFLIALQSDVHRQVGITAIANEKVRRDGIEEAIRWAEALPDEAAGDFKQQAFRRVASAVAEKDPVRAAAWAERQRSGKWGTGLPRRVAQRWSQRDGRAAMDWLRGLPDAPDLPGAFEEAYRTWLGRDRQAARAWLEAQEIDASLDPVVGLYARSTARDDPRAALPWADRVQDPTRRDETLEKIARAWMLRDAEEARAWMETSDLSENAKRRVYEVTAKQRAKPPPRARAPREN